MTPLEAQVMIWFALGIAMLILAAVLILEPILADCKEVIRSMRDD
jgi:hypothetical protein